MRIPTRKSLALAAALSAALTLAGCGHLSHGVVPDGSEAKNPVRSGSVDAAPATATAPVAATPAVKHVKLSARVTFLFDRLDLAAIRPEGRARLDALAQALTATGDRAGAVRVTGHTDRLGSVSYNRQLSEQRAQTVRDYLISRGVAPDRVMAEGRGASDPLVDCDSRSRVALIACLAPNRRVTVDVTRSE